MGGTKLRLVLAGLLVLIMALSLPGPAMAATPDDNGQAYAPDHILVKFLPGTLDTVRASIHNRHGGSVAGVIPDIDVQVVKVPANQVMAKLKAYRGEGRVLFAEPDYIFEAILTPNDPYFGNQWGMVKIQAPQAWDTTTGSPAVKIAILDTGIDQDHEDLAAKIVANQNFSTSGTVDDLYGHGTHVAGIAAAATNNLKGVAGVGFNSSLMNVKVLGDTGSGLTSKIAEGITWAADNGAKVINMSLGGGARSYTLEAAVNDAWSKGVVLVAAAGNDNWPIRMYPAAYTNCIAVAATDQSDAKASFSTYGSWVDVAAPGVGIYSTLPNHTNQIGNNYGSLNGTSMASPFVAGLAGLVWATGYGTGNAAVRSRIESTADAIAGTGTYWRYGRINAYKAVGSTTPPADFPPTVSITSPTNGSFVSGTIAINAIASDDKGVSNVKFYMDTTLLATDTVAPYQYSWNTTTVADGSHAIKAIATDTTSQTAQNTVTVTVDNTQPVVTIVAPAGGATVSGTITIQASVSEANINKVEYQIDGGSLASMTYNSPYWEARWVSTTVGNGAHTITVRATDKAGNLGSDTNNFTVSNQVQAQTMHIKSLGMNLVQIMGGRITYALATATVVDAAGNPVASTQVSGHWEGATTGTGYGTTNASGQVTLRSRAVPQPASGTTFTFVIDSVTKNGWTYDSSANGDFNGDGTPGDIANSITVP